MGSVENTVQKCHTCGELKTLDHFNVTRWGGYVSVCKACITAKRLATAHKQKDLSLSTGMVVRVASGRECKGVTDACFEGVTSRRLLQELQARGYKWSDMWLERVEVVKARVKL